MLQAPTNDRKTKADASAKTAEQLPEQEQFSQLMGGMGQSRQFQPLQQRNNLAGLQKAYGNQAVLRMKGRSPTANPLQGGILQRKCACGSSAGSTGSCAECQSRQEGILQTKLKISETGDRYEQEADRVADQVLAVPVDTAINAASPRIQRLAGEATGESKMAAPASVDRVLSSSGSPLELSLRQDMEQRFGHDFSQVRVHTDADAERSAKAVNALAYTVGSHVVFGSSQYAPTTKVGRHLLAHELAHVVQQTANATVLTQEVPTDQKLKGVRKEAVSIPNHSHTTRRVSRKGDKSGSLGSNVGYVAIYLGGEATDNAYIDFHTNAGIFRYHLEDIGNLRPGEYQSNVVIKGNDVDFTLDVASGELFNFTYRIDLGKPNPKTFFAHQSTVTFTVVSEEAPDFHKSDETNKDDQDSNVVYLTVEEAMRRCESGDMPGIKVFPFRGTRFGGSPLTVFRDGMDIIVKSYVYVLGNEDFKKQTRTLPTETFIGGVRLKPNEVVRVHTYEPRWYHPNITGSTSGDIENEFCVTGEGMLKVGEMSDSTVKWNALLTVVDAVTLIVPVGKLGTIIGKPLLRGGRTLAASMMLGLREAAPTAFAGIASRSATVLVEEQVVDQTASHAISATVSHTILEFSQEPLAQAATSTVREAAGDIASATAAQAFARTVMVTVFDVTGKKIVSKLTTPTGDAALDKMIDEAFSQTFDTSISPSTSQSAQQGVVSVAPEVTAGFTQSQITAFKRILGRRFNNDDIKILEQLWNDAARTGDAAILNLGNSRYLFDLQRNRFWSRVAANPQARALFTDAGCQFSGGAPYYVLNGRRIVITIDHVVERQTVPNLALTASNLQLSFSRENSVVLRLLNQLDPFQ